MARAGETVTVLHGEAGWLGMGLGTQAAARPRGWQGVLPVVFSKC